MGNICVKLVKASGHPQSIGSRVPGSKPDCVTRLVLPSLIHLTYGRRFFRLHQHPASGGQGSGRQNHSMRRHFAKDSLGRRPGTTRVHETSVVS